MRIYSWNVLFSNKRLDRALEFIRSSEFDIFCLQEVPESFLEQLKALNYSIAYHMDAERRVRLPERIYLVTLSKYPIVSTGSVLFPDYWPTPPLRARMFIRLMRPFNFSRLHDHGGLYTDVAIADRVVRVFNLHLLLVHSAWRFKEFELAMTEMNSSLPAIVCGDFNILERLHITPLNWPFGGSLREVLPPRRERIQIEKRFVEHELTNPLLGQTTHPLSQSQLDHILVSRSFVIKDAQVIEDRAGSDHHPIQVEITA